MGYNRQGFSGIKLYRKEYCEHKCLQERNPQLIRKNTEACFVVVTMGQKYDNRQDMALLICR